jgi:TRAP-type C4-dicarboxylate transport system substrate-binding protein
LKSLATQRVTDDRNFPADPVPTQNALAVLLREWNRFTPEVQRAMSALLDLVEKEQRKSLDTKQNVKEM